MADSSAGPTPDWFSYTAPVLNAGTLRLRDIEPTLSGQGICFVTGQNADNDELLLIGFYFGDGDSGLTNANRAVTFGPVENPTQYSCTLVSSPASNFAAAPVAGQPSFARITSSQRAQLSVMLCLNLFHLSLSPVLHFLVSYFHF